MKYTDNNFGLQTEDLEPGIQGYVNSPTPYGISIIRILVKNSGADLETVHALQDGFQIAPGQAVANPKAPALDLSLFNQSFKHPTTQAVYELTSAFAQYNPAEVIQDRSWVSDFLAQAGTNNGSFAPPQGVNLTASVAAANVSVTALQATAGYVLYLGNNWTNINSQAIGNFRSFYASRYFIANLGYGALTSDQALYPQQGGAAAFRLQAHQAYLFTFSGKPKLQPTGFWSLTAYGEDQYLVPNSLGRYALGDRSNLTYPDGTPLTAKADGQFQILLQPADITPPANWTNK